MIAFRLLYRCFYKVLPLTRQKLDDLKSRAQLIPDPELRRQAIASLAKKQFHADGGAVFGAFTAHPNEHLVSAIVAFQTISDYLDNLCDRSTSLEARDFVRMHQAMIDAVSLKQETDGRDPHFYYEFHQEQEDGGYLEQLISITRQNLQALPHYEEVAELVLCLTKLYCELQVHKHVAVPERVPRLETWFSSVLNDVSIHEMLGVDLRQVDLYWWEFAAACGSTLGVFALWTLAAQASGTRQTRNEVGQLYFPWITGLHILLDYWIDQEEDRAGGDLNFFTYYASTDHAYDRLTYFINKAREQAKAFPSQAFHSLLVEGLVGMYLSDRKAAAQPGHERVRRLATSSGWVTKLFYQASQFYRKRTRHA